jgi:Protein of unknown function (DUF2934)
MPLVFRSLIMATEEQIRNYAHLLWERAGRPEGRAEEFWHAAEVDLTAESESPDAATAESPTPSDQASKLTEHDPGLAFFTEPIEFAKLCIDWTEYFYASLGQMLVCWMSFGIPSRHSRTWCGVETSE